jgi:hypothetical protein
LKTSVLYDYFHNFIAQLRSTPRHKKIAIGKPTLSWLSNSDEARFAAAEVCGLRQQLFTFVSQSSHTAQFPTPYFSLQILKPRHFRLRYRSI